MKTKEAPERIWIAPETDLSKLSGHIDKDSVEYIRTDTFIEKVQLFLIDNLKEIPMGGGKMKIKADCSLEEFIDEFRNYMKGE